MKGPDLLESYEDLWVTSMGKWFPGERVVLRGKDMLHDMRGMRWMAQFLFSITGRNFDDSQVRLFEALWSMTVNYPDPRIWPNRVAALAGTVRTTATLGISAALAISEGELFGHRSNIRTIDFIKRAKASVENGDKLESIVRKELKQHRWVPGYGRPIVKNDERIEPVIEFARTLGLADGPHVAIAFEVDKFLVKKRYPMAMNIAALDAALAADQGLSSREYYRYFMLSFLGGMVPAFIDTDEKVEGAFFPLRCAKLKYEGVEKRHWH